MIELTAMPAGDAGALTAELVTRFAGETGCTRWAAQAVMPKTVVPECWLGACQDHRHPDVVERTLRDIDRAMPFLTALPEIMIDYEAPAETHRGLAYEAAVVKQADVWRARGIPTVGLYGLGLGRFLEPVVSAVAIRAAFTALTPSQYLRDFDELERRHTAGDIALAASLGLDYRPYFQGQLATRPGGGPTDPRPAIPGPLLRMKFARMAAAGCRRGILWIDLRQGAAAIDAAVTAWRAAAETEVGP